jgi:allantoinase
MLREGALGFKCFLVDSGVAEFKNLDAGGLEEAMRALAGTNAPLLVHAELPGPIENAHAHGDPASYQRYVASRPHEAEDEAIELVAQTSERTGANAHIVHLSSAHGLDIVARAKRVTAETTPHYLHFDAESIPDGAPEYKCAPPIREHANREALWRGVRDGVIAGIVSDHSPCTPELKKLREGDVERAWGGIASLQFGLSIIWSEARMRGIGLDEVSRLMSEGPASIARIGDRKGKLAAGYDADIIVFDPGATFVVNERMNQHRHKVTPYAGETLSGVVKATYVRGRKVWEDGAHIGAPQGKWLTSAI